MPPLLLDVFVVAIFGVVVMQVMGLAICWNLRDLLLVIHETPIVIATSVVI
jgi:hypothetical protein